jgi:hypothetical protein
VLSSNKQPIIVLLQIPAVELHPVARNLLVVLKQSPGAPCSTHQQEIPSVRQRSPGHWKPSSSSIAHVHVQWYLSVSWEMDMPQLHVKEFSQYLHTIYRTPNNMP